VKPFRFGVQLRGAPDGKTWRATARRIEELGYSTLFVPDHFDDQWGPLVALTAAAEATSTLRVGCLVFDNDYRHPVVLGKEVATLDLLSNGRVEVGLGAGWLRRDYERSGISFDEPSVRIDRLEEALDVYDQLWSGAATVTGSHYRVEDAPGFPAMERRPPLIIGGGGKRVLTLAARRADIVGVNPNLRSGAMDGDAARSAIADRYDERIAWVRAAAGGRFDGLELQVLTQLVAVGGDRDEMARALAPSFGVTEAEARDAPIALVGSVEEICDQLAARRERWGFNYWVVHDTDVDAFAPVVERMAGT
jgi:probable F420-dependent oxidoreductase